MRHFVRRVVLGSLGLTYHCLSNYAPARLFDHWKIAAVEPGSLPDKTLLDEQQKLQLLAVCTEKAFQGDSIYRQQYLSNLKDY